VNLSLEELNSKMREADSNQDGRIDYAGQSSCYSVIPLIEMCGCDWFKSHHVV